MTLRYGVLCLHWAALHQNSVKSHFAVMQPPLHWGILLLPTKAGAASAQPCMHTDNDQVN